jgi:hypothetical protein
LISACGATAGIRQREGGPCALSEAAIDIVVDLGDNETRVDRDGGDLVVADFGKGGHLGGQT